MDYNKITINFSMLGRMNVTTNLDTGNTKCTWSFSDDKSQLDLLLKKLGEHNNGYPYRVDTECLIRNNTLWITSNDTKIEALHHNTRTIEHVTISRAAATYNMWQSHGVFIFWGVSSQVAEDEITGESINVVRYDHVEVELDYLKAVRA